MKKIWTVWLWLLISFYGLPLQAQRIIIADGNYNFRGRLTKITGHVQMEESETKRMEPLQNAAVRVFCLTDSTYQESRATDQKGNFTLHAVQRPDMKYEIQISYIGTDTYKQQLNRSNIIRLDTVTLHEKPITMEEAVIVAKLKKMRILGDTTVFNTDAFRVSEGAVLLELVRKMPGLRISQGKMTYQGKDISEIMLNGEKFFAKDISVALQNMPVDLLKEVRIYDKKSEKSELTGVDDGERTTVMDLKTKKEINNALMANVSAGAGDQDLYGANGMLNYFETKGDRFSVFANQHNTPNDIGMDAMAGSMFRGGFYGGGGNPMKQLSRRFGANFNQNIKKMNVGGDISYNDNGSDTKNYTINENYLPGGNTFSDQSSVSSNNSKNLNASLDLRGELNEHWRIMGNFRFGKNKSHNLNENKQATFDRNPYDYTESPLEQEDDVPPENRINRIDQRSVSYGNNNGFSGMLMLSYRFQKKGRNLTLSLNGDVGDNESRNFQQSSTRYYQLGDSLLYQHRFTFSPTNTKNISAQMSYNEPLTEHLDLELSYEYTDNRNKQDSKVYDIGRLSAFAPNTPLGELPEGYEDTRIDSLSNINNHHDRQHNIELNLHFHNENWFAHLTTGLIPEQQDIYMLREETVTDTLLHRLNFTTRFMVHYQKDKATFALMYNGSSRTPNINQLLPLTNNDNPLYITRGNPNLKSSFSHIVHANFRCNQLWANVSFNQSFNDIANKTDYDAKTGVRTSYPDNINGNWNLNGNVGYSKDWEVISLESETRYGFDNRVNYVSVESQANKDNIRNHTFSQMFKGIYTPEWAEFILSGEVQLDKTQSKLQKDADNFTKTFTFLGETVLYLPWDIRLSSTFSCITRRGFLSDEMNHSELLWNASASYSFLKKKQASLKLEVFDILQRSTNFNAYTSSTGRVQSRSEGINSYFLCSFNYRFNLFQGKKNKQN